MTTSSQQGLQQTTNNNTAPPTELLTKEYLPFISETRNTTNKLAFRNKILHYITQGTIIISTTAITATLGIPSIPQPIPIILSAIATITTGLAQVFRFSDRSKDLYITTAMIDKESRLASFNTGPYENLDPDTTIKLLVSRVEDIMQKQVENYASLEAFQPNKK